MFDKNIIIKTPKAFAAEKDFQGWFGKEMKTFGYHYKKMSDMSIDKKDCDCYAIDYKDGVTHWCELKKIDGYTLNLNHYQTQQITFLNKIASCPYSTLKAWTPVYSRKLQAFILLDWKELYPLLVQGGGSAQIFERPGRC